MTKLVSLFLTATLSLASSAALATETNTQPNNGQADSSADAGQVAPDARENVTPNNVDSSSMNSGGTMLHPNGSSMNHGGVIKDKMCKNTICEDGCCPDMNRKVETGNSINSDVETEADGATQ